MATADQIVDTAVELGEQRSWEAVRLHDIAASLGITLDDVRAYFREKEDIVDAWLGVPIALCSKRRKFPIFPI